MAIKPTNLIQWISLHSFNENIPLNLDDMGEYDLAELVEFDDNDESARLHLCQACWSSEQGVIGYRAAEISFRYARCKLKAIWARLDGRIAEALTYEKYCDEYYQELPEFARW